MTTQHTQLKDKLTKIYSLAVSQCNENEAAAALNKLNVLCKKHSIRLKDFVFYSILDIDYSKKKAVQVNTSTDSTKRASRRSLIIKHVVDNTHTTASLAKLLADNYNYNDLSANRKAVAGTLYDMLKQNKFKKVIRHENNKIEVVV